MNRGRIWDETSVVTTVELVGENRLATTQRITFFFFYKVLLKYKGDRESF